MIKVLVPHMPTADDLLPYLREIDRTRIYVKGGPLVRRLEMELTALTRAPCVAVGNGTVSLELALRAMDLPRGSGVLVPAVTFVASGQAIVNAGLHPVICDVAADTWQLDADPALQIIAHAPVIRAVMPVAAFGRAVAIGPWERFVNATGGGIRVLIDAAGAIYDQRTSELSAIAVSFSLNATKALGAGEGGIVACADLALLERVAWLANFGPGGTNARMSEYHAAVGLASLSLPSRWRADVIAWYAERGIAPYGGLQTRRTLMPVLLPSHCSADAVCADMALAGIETRTWYRPFLDERDEFFTFPKYGPMPHTAALRERLLGLPYHAFLTRDDVRAVCDNLERLTA